MDFKRVVTIGDMHCGHLVGLTPRAYQSQIHGMDYYKIQAELWNYYETIITDLKPIDILVHNGDAIDGAGSRSGGTELLTTDPNRQVDIAYDALSVADAGKYILSYGTSYHTGMDTDYEKVLADKLGGIIKSQAWIDVNGTVFDIKHHIGNSAIPHGKGTPISKERLWNHLWAAHEEQPKANVYLRSHVHNLFFCGGPDWMGLTLPALQGQGSKFGARRCSQEVHFGVIWFDCFEDGSFAWDQRILRAESQKQVALVL